MSGIQMRMQPDNFTLKYNEEEKVVFLAENARYC